MKILFRRVVPYIASYWFDIGLELLGHEHVSALHSVEADYRSDANTCVRKMLQLWLEIKVDADWNQLLESFRRINLQSFASSIENMLLKGIIPIM